MKYLLLFVILGFSLSACLTVEETYTFNSDGSGKAVFQIRLTDMEAVLNQAKWDGSEENLKQLSFESLALQLRTLEGLNEVSILDNLQQHTWGVAFSFDHVLALNQALNVILIDKPHDNWHTFFVHSKQGIARSHQMDNLRIGEILRNDPQFSSHPGTNPAIYALPHELRLCQSGQSGLFRSGMDFRCKKTEPS
jgi:hypothetical protein